MPSLQVASLSSTAPTVQTFTGVAALPPLPADAGEVTKGSWVTLASLHAIQEKDDAALGPLKPGDYGVVTEDDKSTKPFKVRLGPARTR